MKNPLIIAEEALARLLIQRYRARHQRTESMILTIDKIIQRLTETLQPQGTEPTPSSPPNIHVLGPCKSEAIRSSAINAMSEMLKRAHDAGRLDASVSIAMLCIHDDHFHGALTDGQLFAFDLEVVDATSITKH